MKRIIFIAILTFISCSGVDKKHVSKCNITLTNQDKEKVENENIKINLELDNKSNKLFLSVTNIGDKDIYFISPKIIFALSEETKEDINKDAVVKPYIKQVVADKIYTSIVDESNQKRIIDIDSTMQRNDNPKVINLAPKNIYRKEFELNCKKSDGGRYKIIFPDRSINYSDSRIIKVNYPKNVSVLIK